MVANILSRSFVRIILEPDPDPEAVPPLLI